MIHGVDMSMVSEPHHYDGDGVIRCSDALASMMARSDVPSEASYYCGCSFKYLLRWHLKDGIEDLYKCRHCLDMMIESLEKVN